MNYDAFRVFWGHYPSGSSLKCLMHYSQIYRAKRFQEYNYGPTMNYRLYNQRTPPSIDLSPINDLGIPNVLIIGKSDSIVSISDANWVKSQIANSVTKVIEEEGGHNHFFFGNNADYF